MNFKLTVKLLPIFLVAFFIVLMSSCSKEDNTTNPLPTVCGLSCKVDGTDWCDSASFNLTSAGGKSTLIITSANSNGNIIELTLISDSTVITGSYDIKIGSTSASYKKSGELFIAQTGNIKLTSLTDSLKANFNFDGRSSKGNVVKIINGNLSIKMPE